MVRAVKHGLAHAVAHEHRHILAVVGERAYKTFCCGVVAHFRAVAADVVNSRGAVKSDLYDAGLAAIIGGDLYGCGLCGSIEGEGGLLAVHTYRERLAAVAHANLISTLLRSLSGRTITGRDGDGCLVAADRLRERCDGAV